MTHTSEILYVFLVSLQGVSGTTWTATYPDGSQVSGTVNVFRFNHPNWPDPVALGTVSGPVIKFSLLPPIFGSTWTNETSPAYMCPINQMACVTLCNPMMWPALPQLKGKIVMEWAYFTHFICYLMQLGMIGGGFYQQLANAGALGVIHGPWSWFASEINSQVSISAIGSGADYNPFMAGNPIPTGIVGAEDFEFGGLGMAFFAGAIEFEFTPDPFLTREATGQLRPLQVVMGVVMILHLVVSSAFVVKRGRTIKSRLAKMTLVVGLIGATYFALSLFLPANDYYRVYRWWWESSQSYNAVDWLWRPDNHLIFAFIM